MPEPEIVEKPTRGRPPKGKGQPKGARFPALFRQRDLKEAIKAARGAGLENFRVDVDKSGTISVVPMAPDGPAASEGAGEWDKLLDEK